MAPDGDSATWSSPREHTLSAAEWDAIGALRETDERIGLESAERYGPREAAVPPAPVGRVVRAAARRVLHSRPGSFATKAALRARREVWRRSRVTSRPLRTAVGRVRFELLPEPDESGAANAVLEATDATHLVIVREGGAPLSEGIERTAALLDDPDVQLLYGDSRRPNGIRSKAPAPSPYRLREEDYLGPVVIVSTAALRAIGGFRPEADRAHILDITLRLGADHARRAEIELGVGVPIDRPEGARADAAASVIGAHLDVLGIDAAVEVGEGVRTIVYPVRGEPLVSVIIPTRGGSGIVGARERCFVVEAVRGLIERTSWKHLEIVVVADDPTPQAVVDELEAIAGDRLVLVRWSEPFNFSEKMNRGAAVARGDYLLMLNDDIEVVNDDWLDRMLGLAQQPDVGEVGALLFFESGEVQHLGHIHEGGAAGHVGFGLMPGAYSPMPRLGVTREASGVTAACALVRAEVFRRVGGFSPVFPGNYNDVDLSLKIRSEGLATVCSGAARLYHFESQTRDATVLESEFEAIRSRWSRRMQTEQYARGPMVLVP